MKHLRLSLQILLPLVVLAGGVWLAKVLADKAKVPLVTRAPFLGPFVRTHVATTTDLRLDVATQGTVEPFRTIDVTTQVGGRILTTSPSLRTGGSCVPGDVLLAIDDTDLKLVVIQQEAAVARAELQLLQEQAEGDSALRAWQQLEGDRVADALVMRKPQINDARMALAAARAMLERSRLDLERTKVTAPVAGRVRSVEASVGQTVQAGQRLAVVLDTSCVEVRLPIPVAEAAFLDLPLDRQRDATGPSNVTLSTEFAGQPHEWTGHVVRTEGEIDRRTRQLTIVARVAGDQANGDGAGRPPLLVGMFVQARIEGRLFANVVAIPRVALRDGDHVWVADAEHRLQRRPVQVLRTEADRVVLTGGIAAGEHVVVTTLDTPTDGMPVRLDAEVKGNPIPESK